jgi:hypothetical protein
MAAAVLAAGLALAACGGGRDQTGPTAVTVPVAPGDASAVTSPAVTAPAGDRLAIATAAGLEIWSASTGVFTVGPAMENVVVSDLAWSPDGAYLSWQTVPAGPGRPGTALWYAAVRTGITEHWGPLGPGRSYGPVVVTDAGVLTLGAHITRYASSGGVTVGAPAPPDPTGSQVASWLHGWVVQPAGDPAGRPVRLLSAAGTDLAPHLVLDIAPGSRRLDLVAVAADGQEVASELGRHGAGCEVTGSAQLVTVRPAHGGVSVSRPPTVTRGATQRFWAIDVSGPPGSIYASTFDCATKGKGRGRVTSTVLWSLHAGRWKRVGAHLVAGSQLGQGPLATLAGDVEVTHGVAAVAGGGAVRVNGHIVATGGQAIAWSPAVSPEAT